jgi:hypothetical protein
MTFYLKLSTPEHSIQSIQGNKDSVVSSKWF